MSAFLLSIAPSWFEAPEKLSVSYFSKFENNKSTQNPRKKKKGFQDLVPNVLDASQLPLQKCEIDSKESTKTKLTAPQFAIVPHAGYAYTQEIIKETLKDIEFENVNLIVLLSAFHKPRDKSLGSLIQFQCLSPETETVSSDPKISFFCKKFSLFRPHKEKKFQEKQSHNKYISFSWEKDNRIMAEEHSWQVPLPILSAYFCQKLKNPTLWPLLVPSSSLSNSNWKAVSLALLRVICESNNEDLKNSFVRPLFLVSSDFTHIGTRFRYFPTLWDRKNKQEKYGGASQKATDREGLLSCNDNFSFLSLFSFELWDQKKDNDTICGWGAIRLLMSLVDLFLNPLDFFPKVASTPSNSHLFSLDCTSAFVAVPSLIACSRSNKQQGQGKREVTEEADAVSYLGVTWKHFVDAPFHLVPSLSLLFLLDLKIKDKNNTQLKSASLLESDVSLNSANFIKWTNRLYKDSPFFSKLKKHFLQTNQGDSFPKHLGKGVFVTIREGSEQGRLRGCIGTFEENVDSFLTKTRKKGEKDGWCLLELITYYTLVTLFQDTRFSDAENSLRGAFLTYGSLASFFCKLKVEIWSFEVSLLYKSQPLSYESLKQKYNPCSMGIVLEYQGQTSTFLPKVALEERWISQCPLEKEETTNKFLKTLLSALLRKMGIRNIDVESHEFEKYARFSVYASKQYLDRTSLLC